MTTEQLALRRKIAAAKSYLSRLDNQRREVLRNIILRNTERAGDSGIDEYRHLTNKRDQQYFKFRELCSQLPDDDL